MIIPGAVSIPRLGWGQFKRLQIVAIPAGIRNSQMRNKGKGQMNAKQKLKSLHKEYAILVSRQQLAISVISRMAELKGEPRLTRHLQESVYEFFKPSFDRNQVERELLESLDDDSAGNS